jgi:hypothetical protein
MYLIFASIVVAAVVSVMLFKYGDDGYKGRHFLAGIVGVLMGIGTGLSALVYAFAVWGWIAADHKAQIINREYGTNYTQAEVFYASDVIDTVRQLDRKRYEINGDLVRGQEAKP